MIRSGSARRSLSIFCREPRARYERMLDTGALEQCQPRSTREIARANLAALQELHKQLALLTGAVAGAGGGAPHHSAPPSMLGTVNAYGGVTSDPAYGPVSRYSVAWRAGPPVSFEEEQQRHRAAFEALLAQRMDDSGGAQGMPRPAFCQPSSCPCSVALHEPAAWLATHAPQPILSTSDCEPAPLTTRR